MTPEQVQKIVDETISRERLRTQTLIDAAIVKERLRLYHKCARSGNNIDLDSIFAV